LKYIYIVFLVGVLITILLIGILHLYNPTSGLENTSTENISSTTSGSQHPAPYISNITIMGFHVKDGELYMRLRVYGYVYLRDKVSINGVYDFWFGVLKVILPYGEEALLYDPGNYVDVVMNVNEIYGSRDFDAELPLSGDKPGLDGLYNITFYLKGPYDNVSILYQKTVNLTILFKISISPTNISTWNETMRVTINNTGDLPVILDGVGLAYPIPNGTIGVIEPLNYSDPGLIVMPGESSTWIGRLNIDSDMRIYVAGKTLQIYINTYPFTANRFFTETITMSFPPYS